MKNGKKKTLDWISALALHLGWCLRAFTGQKPAFFDQAL